MVAYFKIFRSVVSSVEERAQRELDAKSAELAEKMAQTRLEQIELTYAQDLEVLKKRVPTAETEAIEAARDQAYLKDRQRNLDMFSFQK